MTLNDYPDVKTIKELAKTKKAQVYLVGGFLRDLMLYGNEAQGKDANRFVDFDFAVDANALKFAENFSKEIKGAYIVLDEEHGCARVVKKMDGKILTYDFADFRAKTIEEDVALRDFTINTLSVHLNSLSPDAQLKSAVIDHKRALKDIEAKRLKRVGIKSFRDDPLRMLRAFSLKANLGFRIELSTLNQIKKEREKLRDVSYERIREEFFKILDSPRCAEILKEMDRVGLLEVIIPQIRVMYDCTQGAYHHLDVWPHSLEAVFQLDRLFAQLSNNQDVVSYLNEDVGGNHTRRSIIKFALLLHDIGKPDTRKIENGKYSFHGHEHVGKNITRAVAQLFKISTHERHILEDMVQMHLRPGYLSNFKSPSERMIFRFFRDAKEEAASILLLSLADQRATRGPMTTQEDQKHHEAVCLSLVERFFEKKKEKPFIRLIDGHDVMKHLKIKPSALIGRILTEVEENQVLGRIKTKKEALAFSKKIADKISG